VQLAEDWLSNSYHILEMPFLDSNYHSALMDVQQFLWADHDMDSVYYRYARAFIYSNFKPGVAILRYSSICVILHQLLIFYRLFFWVLPLM
jgi:hypothetical protein